MTNYFIKFVLIGILAYNFGAYAGTTGKIAGRVTDAGTGEPLIGANILVKSTAYGASSDLEGNYVILNLPPGEYTLEVMYIGYNNKEITNVPVSIDLTTNIDITLTETTLEATETVTVVADRPAIQKDITSTTAIVDGEQIESLPVTEINEILELQAGFVDGHVRGGRTGEVAYWIDGVPVTDSFDGGQVIEVNKDMVEELQFISGAFNAEYGQAMSGVVNITTKEPTENFGGNLTLYVGDYYSQNNDIFGNLNNFNPSNIYNMEGGIFGSIIPQKLSYYLNGRYIYFGGWYYGKEVYEPHNISYEDSVGNYVLNRDENGLGDGDYVPMNWNQKIYSQLKLIYNPSATMKVVYNFLRDDVEFEDYDRAYRLNPNGNLNKFRTGNTHLLKFSHTVNKTTFYDISYSYFSKSFEQYVYEDRNDSRYVHPKVGSSLPNYNYRTGGMNNYHFNRETKTMLLKMDLTSQITSKHLLKFGAEIRRNKVSLDEIWLQAEGGDELDLLNDSPYMDPIDEDQVPISSPDRNKYEHNPIEVSFYLQDKIEFKDIIVNLGLRLDHFRPDGVMLSDPSDPNVYDPIRPSNRYQDINQNGIFDEGIDKMYTLEERKSFWYEEASNKTQVSPRLGVSFPVTETGVVHFSYGHFFQIPNFEYLYRNPQFKLGTGTGNQGIIGNADLDPEQTISGEIGYKQEVGSGIVLDVTAYFRDVRNLVGTRADEIELFGGFASYSKLVNSDFGLTKGIILSMRNRYRKGINYTFDYTFQIAEGTASDPNQAQVALASGNQPEVHLVPLSWDQRHTLNSTVSYVADSWGLSFIGNLGSGLPYTPRKTEDVSQLRENSEDKPATWNIDMRLHKDFEFFNQQFTYFLRVLNVFDHLNETGVYDDTGRAGFTTDLERIRDLNPEMPVNSLDSWFTNETYYSEPRRIETGITIKF